MNLRFCLWILVFLLVFQLLKNAQASTSESHVLKTYTVQIEGEKFPQTFKVKALSDVMALDGVYVSYMYKKHRNKIIKASVLETKLSTEGIIPKHFSVYTEERSYPLIIPVSDPYFAMTVIQAAKALMSRTSVREIYYGDSKLKSMDAVKVQLELKSKKASYFLNSQDRQFAKYALEIATQVSKYAPELIKAHVAELPLRTSSVGPTTCKGLFTVY